MKERKADRPVAEAFGEHREVSVSEPLRQGDVLEAADPEASKWERHLLVITADCDFAQGKHHGRVTCVPLLRADEYLLEMQVPRLREKYIGEKLLPQLRKVLEESQAPNVSDDRLRAWPLETDVTEIVTALGLDGTKADLARVAFEALRLLGKHSTSLDEAVLNLMEGQLAGPYPKSRDNIVKSISQGLKGPYSQPPGDALFLSSIAPRQEVGYFAYLRHLEQVREQEITTGPTRRSVPYRRISRLQDRYTHAMVQRFALVFMSIGLPKEYEDTRDLYSEQWEETCK